MRSRARRSSLASQIFEITLPATSANLGPAFDTAALALRLNLKVRARMASDFSVSAHGRDAVICGRIEDHLILNTYREVLQSQGKPTVPLALRIDNQIPIGKGCGSSAAARLAGIALAVRFGKLPWDDARIIAEASRREHHPDNAAACWLGGVAVAKVVSETEVLFVKLAVRGKWPLLLAVPDEPLSTEKARSVLPAQYSRQDVVVNLQNSMLLQAGLAQGRADLVSAALDDRMHQPYRAPLCPLVPALAELTGTAGILGSVLSGAGSSVLLFLGRKTSIPAVKSRIQKHLRSRNLGAELIATAILDRGGRDQIVSRRSS